jgi:hypothetical protein
MATKPATGAQPLVRRLHVVAPARFGVVRQEQRRWDEVQAQPRARHEPVLARARVQRWPHRWARLGAGWAA